MSAHHYDNILRYHVDSGTRPQVKHLVDLDLYDGNGACSCEHFTFGLEKHLKAGLRANPSMRVKPGTDWWDALRCHHIREARAKLADDVIRQAKGNGILPKAAPSAKPHPRNDHDGDGPCLACAPAKARPVPQPRKKAGKRRVYTLK